MAEVNSRWLCIGCANEFESVDAFIQIAWDADTLERLTVVSCPSCKGVDLLKDGDD